MRVFPVETHQNESVPDIKARMHKKYAHNQCKPPQIPTPPILSGSAHNIFIFLKNIRLVDLYSNYAIRVDVV